MSVTQPPFDSRGLITSSTVKAWLTLEVNTTAVLIHAIALH